MGTHPLRNILPSRCTTSFQVSLVAFPPSLHIFQTFNQKVDRAQQQLIQAGEIDKQSTRAVPLHPWPLAILATPRRWNEDDAKQIWNHNYQKLYPRTPPVYYFGERVCCCPFLLMWG